MVEIVVGINLIRSGLYGEDKGKIYFIIFKLLGKYKKIHIMEMTWLLTWLNVSVVTLNAMLQLLVILVVDPRVAHDNIIVLVIIG